MNTWKGDILMTKKQKQGLLAIGIGAIGGGITGFIEVTREIREVREIYKSLEKSGNKVAISKNGDLEELVRLDLSPMPPAWLPTGRVVPKKYRNRYDWNKYLFF